MRLDKYLADMNLGTRSELKKAIRSGAASVGDQMIKDPGYAVKESDEVFWHGKPVKYEKNIYLMLHKPAGVVSATKDNVHRTVLDLLPQELRRDVFPVGRLDIDTEGLLLMTNDGELSHRLLSPRHHVDKTYYAKLDCPAEPKDVRIFAEGFRADDELTALPSKLEILSDEEIRLTIHEGKFHQVKRMMHAVGKEVTYLKRLSMGPLQLDSSLKPGDFRRLTEDEVRRLQEVDRDDQSK